jgi:pimeloyl-ACP methyl ester carboxylesterase
VRRLAKVLRWTALGLLAAVALSLAGTWVHQQRRHADASPAALAAAVSDATVRLDDDGDTLVLRPVAAATRGGVILYPGAYVDVRGYVPTLKPLAAAGYRVVIVRMPFELAIFGVDRAAAIMADHADITRWVLVGHSVGGAMAAAFAARHRALLDGVIIWDSYPPSMANFAQYPKPVWHIHRARPDGSPPAAFTAQRAQFPADSRWLPIRGGVHMQFGSFEAGGYEEDWPPTITRAEQHAAVVRATLAALDAMVRNH